MATRNVVLTDHQDRLIEELVSSGRYQNASEAMRAGLRLLETEEATLMELRNRLEQGLRDVDAGERAPGTGEDAIRRAFAAAKAIHDQRTPSGQ